MLTSPLARSVALLALAAVAGRAQQPAEAARRLELRDRAAMQRYDLDGDGRLSPQERQLASREIQHARNDEARRPDERMRDIEQFKRLLAAYDKDGDGKLSAAERELLTADYTAELSRRVGGDGNLSLEAWLAARDAWRDRVGTGGGL